MIKIISKAEYDKLINNISNLTKENKVLKEEKNKQDNNNELIIELNQLKRDNHDLINQNQQLKDIIEEKPMRNEGKVNDILINIKKINPAENILFINKLLDEEKIKNFLSQDFKEEFVYFSNYIFLNYDKSIFFSRLEIEVKRMFETIYMRKSENEKFYNTHVEAKNDYIRFLSYKMDFYCKKNFKSYPTRTDISNKMEEYNKMITRLNVALESINKKPLVLFRENIKEEIPFILKKFIEFNEILIKLYTEFSFFSNREKKILEILELAKRLNLESNYYYIKLNESMIKHNRGRYEDYRDLYYLVEAVTYEYKIFEKIKKLGYSSLLVIEHEDIYLDIHTKGKRIQIKNLNSHDYLTYSNRNHYLEKYKEKLIDKTNSKSETKMIWLNTLKINEHEFKKIYKDPNIRKELIK